MTNDVLVSITISVGNRENQEILFTVSPRNLIETINKVQIEFAQILFILLIRVIDDIIKNTIMKGKKILGKEKRTISTLFGMVTFYRRVYQDETGKRVKPVDDELGLKPYERRDQKLKETNCVLAAGSNYRTAAWSSLLLTHTYSSPATIHRDVKETGSKIAQTNQNFEPEQAGKTEAQILYGESDGVFVRLQKDKNGKKFGEIRLGIAYTGKKWLSGNRYHLKNKVTIVGMDIDSLQWQEMIRNHLYATYDFNSIGLLAVGGDGGSWVGSTFDLCNVRKTERVLDKFHVKRALRQAFGKSLDLNNDVYPKLFTEGLESIENLLCQQLEKGSYSEKNAKKACLKYLKNHEEEILPLSQRCLPFPKLESMGCIESNIGKKIALRMKTRGCSWSRDGANAMAAILCASDELSSHIFSYQELPKGEIRNQKASKYKSSQNKSQIHKASFPILKAGKLSTPFYSLFKNIIIGKELP